MGVEPNYIFAVIDDAERLYAVGRSFRKEGAQKISIKRVTGLGIASIFVRANAKGGQPRAHFFISPHANRSFV
jgi:hypothetical protein